MSILALGAPEDELKKLFGFFEYGKYEVEDTGNTFTEEGTTYSILALWVNPLEQESFEKKLTDAGFKFKWL